ncbi:unnamed protein product, partial [Rangifer tarandus platyrhynchus]
RALERTAGRRRTPAPLSFCPQSLAMPLCLTRGVPPSPPRPPAHTLRSEEELGKL